MVRPKYKAEKSDSIYATIWVDRSSGKICLRTPYNEEYLEEFRKLIPKEYRQWDRSIKVWLIDPHFMEDIVRLCEKYFRLDVLPESSSNGNCYREFLMHVSKEALSRIWKIVAKDLHPDHGGDARKFIRAKDAYEKILEEIDNA